MTDRPVFFCSRTERGQTQCDVQCDDCTKRQTMTIGDKLAEKPAGAQEQTPPAEGPQVRATLTVILYEDGNAKVNGPYEDRLLFHGLIWIAEETERVQHARMMAQRARLAQQPKESWAKGLARKFMGPKNLS